MAHYQLKERGRTPEGIHFCVLSDPNGRLVVSLDIETVWRAQDRRRQHLGRAKDVTAVAYHKRTSKLRGT